MKNSLSALPVYLILLIAVSVPVYLIPSARSAVLNALALFNVRVSALFGLCICFALCWVLLGLIVRVVRIIVGR